MPDVVGSAAISVSPDLSDFASQLAAAIGPALAASTSAVTSAAQDMAKGLEVVGTTAEDVGEITAEAFDGALNGAADQVAAASSSMVSSFGDVEAASASTGVAIDATIAPAAASAAADVGVAATSMIGELGSVEGGVSGVTDAIEGIAAGVTETAVPAMQDFGDAGGAAMSEIGTQAEDAAAKVESSLTDSVLTVRDLITGVALGDLLAEGISGGLGIVKDAVLDLVSYIPELGAESQRNFNKMRVAVGTNVEELAAMKESFSNIYSSSSSSAEDITFALQQTRGVLKLTGAEAETITKAMLKFAKVTGSDVGNTVETTTELFKLFGTSVGDQSGQLDRLLRVSQATHRPVEELIGQVSQFAPKFKAAGFSIDEVAVLVGKLGESGVPVAPVMMGINQFVAKLADSGKDGKAGLQLVLDEIMRAPDATSAASIAVDTFGKRAGPLLADQVRAGNLAIADLVSSVQTGGDTVQAAGEDMGDWTGQIEILRHQLAEVFAPIARTVFMGLRDAANSVRPIISLLVSAVGERLTPVFETLTAIALPVWDVLDRIRQAIGGLIEGITKGYEPWFLLVSFLDKVSGNTEWAVAVTKGVIDFRRALLDMWETLLPVRDAISGVFTTITDAVGGFIRQNPGTILIGLAATITAIAVPAIISLGSTIVGALASATAAAAGFLAIPVAIGAVVAGVIYAYTHFESFKNVVDGFVEVVILVGTTIGTALTPVLETLRPVLDWMAEHWYIFAGALAAVLVPFAAIPIAIAAVVGAAIALRGVLEPVALFVRDALVAAFEALRGVWEQVWPILVEGATTLANVWTTTIQPAVGQLVQSFMDLATTVGNLLRPILTWLLDHWQIVAGALALLLVPLIAIPGAFVLLYAKVEPFRNLISGILDVLKPLISAFIDIAGNVIGNVIKAVSGLLDILTGLLSWDFDKVKEGFAKIGEAILSVMSNIGSHIWDLLQTIGPLIVDALMAAWDWVVANGPGILASFAGWLLSLPGTILGWLGNLGATLLGWLVDAFGWVLSGLGAGASGIASGLWNWFTSLPAQFLDALSASLSFILDFLVRAVLFTVEKLPGIIGGIIDFFEELPYKILVGIGSLGQFFEEKVFAPAFNFLVETLPNLILNVINWFTSLPGQLIDAMFGLGDKIIGWLRGAFDSVVEQAPGLITGVIDFFRGLPVKIFDAIKSGLTAAGGAIGDLAKSLYNAVSGFVNDKLLIPVRSFKVTILNHDFTPFEGIPLMPQLADGGVFRGVQGGITATIAEAGDEAVVPLSNRARAAQVAVAAGIPQILASQGIGGGGNVINLDVYVQATPETTREHAQMVGDEVADAAARRMAITSAVHVA